MNAEKNQWELFGFDLSRLGSFLRLGVQQVLFDRSSWLARTFQPYLLLRGSDGWSAWTAAGRLPQSSTELAALYKTGKYQFYAAEIPAEQVLVKTVWLPESEELFLALAVELEASVASPFSDEERVVGWSIINRVEGTIEVAIAISSKGFAKAAREAWLRDHDTHLDPNNLGLCAFFRENLIEFSGYENPARSSLYFKRLRSAAAFGGIVFACALLATTLPVASSAYRSMQLQEHSDAMRAEASMVDDIIDNLHRQRARTDFLRAQVDARPNYALRLDSIAAATPDDTFIESLRMSVSEVEVTGYSKNAANFLRLLTEEAQFSNVNARSAFLREQRSGLERFSINWTFVDEVD